MESSVITIIVTIIVLLFCAVGCSYVRKSRLLFVSSGVEFSLMQRFTGTYSIGAFFLFFFSLFCDHVDIFQGNKLM